MIFLKFQWWISIRCGQNNSQNLFCFKKIMREKLLSEKIIFGHKINANNNSYVQSATLLSNDGSNTIVGFL
jgi:hypothetical protein